MKSLSLSCDGGQPWLPRFNRCKCAHLLRDLAASAGLPPQSAPEAEDPDTDVNDIYTLAAAAYICIKLHSAKYPDRAPFHLPDPRQPARSLTDLLTALAAILGRRQPHNVPPQPGQSTKLLPKILDPGVSELRVADPHWHTG